jgi:ubiquitin carboxyl-terminal hydrolase 4/11/15
MAVSVSTPPHGGGVSDAPIDLCDDSSGPTGADDSEDGEDTAFASGPQTMKSVVPEAFGSRATRGAEEGVDGGAGGASAPDVATERAAAQSLSEHQIRARDKYYVVPKKWFDEWENYASFGDNGIIAPPGAIDMAQILEADGEPQKALYHESDYEVVPEELWLLLKRRYGVGTGIEIARTAVINTGTRRATVPLYPLIVHVLRPGMAECEKSKIRIFASATLQELKEKACAELGIASDANPKLCSFVFNDAEDEQNDLTKTLAETAVSEFDDFLIQTDADGDDGSQGSLGNTDEPSPKRPRSSSDSAHSSPNYNTYGSLGSGGSLLPRPSPPFGSTDQPSSPQRSPGLFSRGNTTPASYGHGTSSCSTSSNDWDTTSASDGTRPGECGLNNLGNTCFMASGLQCLIHTDEMRTFFTSNDFEAQINADNVLGCKGQMAREYGALVQKIHGGKYSSVAPRSFKKCLSEFAPQFSGYDQHDSQEFLNFLLDGLHEDLNRCREKPATEIPEAKGRPDEQVASEAWDVHKKRNDSVILDSFGAQFKSTVKCPDCPRVSITFDPYMMMSIPLPVTEKSVTITMVFHKHRQPAQKLAVKGNRAGNVRKFLSKKFDIDVDRILICEVHNHKVFGITDEQDDDNFLVTTDTWMAYEVGVALPDAEKTSAYSSRYSSYSEQDSKVTTVKIMQLVAQKSRWKTNYSSSSYSSTVHVGSPLVLREIKKDFTVQDVAARVSMHMEGLLKAELEDWRHIKRAKRRPAGPLSEYDYASSDENDDNDDTKGGEEQEEEGSQRPPPFILQFPGKSNIDLSPVGKYWESRLTDEDVQELELIWNRDFYDKYILVSSSSDDEAHRRSRNDERSCRSCFIETAFEEPRPEVEEEDEAARKGRGKDGRIHLEDCLKLMTEEETLGEDNTWYCSDCKDHKQASKTLALWSAPDVLILHLKRFSYTR